MPRNSTPEAPAAPQLFCSPCLLFRDGLCAGNYVAAGEDITTVSACNHRELPGVGDSITSDAGDAPAQEI